MSQDTGIIIVNERDLEKLARQGKNILITGGAGTGKTWLVNKFLEKVNNENTKIRENYQGTTPILDSKGKKVRPFRIARLATTGIAATHINGQTLDSFFHLRGASKVSEIKKVKWDKCFQAIDSIDCFLTDEISMKRVDKFELIVAIFRKYYAYKIDEIRSNIFLIKNSKSYDVKRVESLERKAKGINELLYKIDENGKVINNKFSFGYKSIIFVGDFGQIPSVVKYNEKFVKVKGLENKFIKFNPWIFKSPLWQEANFHNIVLTEIKRQENPEFAKILNFIRVGKVTIKADKMLKERNFKEYEDVLADIESRGLKVPPVLCPTNAMISGYNNKMVNEIEGREINFQGNFSINPLFHEEEDQHKDLIFAALKNTLMEKDLILKVGCRIMFLTNDKAKRFVNGTSGTLKSLGRCFNISVTKYQMLDDFFEEENVKYEILKGGAASFGDEDSSSDNCYVIDVDEDRYLELKGKFIDFHERHRLEMKTPLGKRVAKLRSCVEYCIDKQGEIEKDKKGNDKIKNYTYSFGSPCLVVEVDAIGKRGDENYKREIQIAVTREDYAYSEGRSKEFRIENDLPESEMFEADITFRQFPVKLAYSLTFHKSQGATYQYAIIDFRSPHIGDGSAYVALSRVVDIENLYLIGWSKNKVRASGDVIAYYKKLHKAKELFDESELIRIEKERKEEERKDKIFSEVPWEREDFEYEELFKDSEFRKEIDKRYSKDFTGQKDFNIKLMNDLMHDELWKQASFRFCDIGSKYIDYKIRMEN